MFTAAHLIIDVTRGNKSLKRLYKATCQQLNVSAPLKIAPSHRFGYRVMEARCVLTALQPLVALYADSRVVRQHNDVPGIEDVVAYLVGSKLVGEGRNKFKLDNLLAATTTALEALTTAIERLEADRPMASVVLPIWRTIIEKVAPLGAVLQRELRGRGAAAAQEKEDLITDLLTKRCAVYCTPEIVAATLIDPINAIKQDGIWHAGFSWLTAAEKNGAALKVASIAEALTPGSGGAARLQFRQLLAVGFAAEFIALCRMAGKQEGEVVWADVQTRRLAWELELASVYPALAPVAARLLSQHATSCAVERFWSRWRSLYASDRSRMLASTAQRYMFISTVWHLSNRVAAREVVPENVFWEQQQGLVSEEEEEEEGIV
jgi:hypothetical protein